VRYRILTTVLRWLAVTLVLRVLATILSNYPDYLPPNFDSLFLEGREATFTGAYRAAFYVHIFTGPVVLFSGLILLSEYIRRNHARWHRVLGRAHVGVLLVFVLPGALVMSRHAFGGWPAGLSFLLLSAATASCAIVGVRHAQRHRFQQHRSWMLRSYVLICSAVALRLISGTVGMVGVSSPQVAYCVAAWVSWLLPLTVFEVVERLPACQLSRRAAHSEPSDPKKIAFS
jgi:hypothetical protein